MAIIVHVGLWEETGSFFFLLFEKPKMATNAQPRSADLHNTHYILPERRQNRKFFCLLLGENPKMATNAHPRVADLLNTQNILPKRKFSVRF